MTPERQQTPAPRPCLACEHDWTSHAQGAPGVRGYCIECVGVLHYHSFVPPRPAPSATPPTPVAGEPSEEAVQAAFHAVAEEIFDLFGDAMAEATAITGMRAALKAAYAVDFGATRGAGAEPL